MPVCQSALKKLKALEFAIFANLHRPGHQGIPDVFPDVSDVFCRNPIYEVVS